MKLKLSPVREVLYGKRVVVVDDSIVRGTTSRKIVDMLRVAGAREVHMRISSPPTVGPCSYGIDTPTREELIALDHSGRADPRASSAPTRSATCRWRACSDSVNSASDGPKDGFCDACFSNDYPIQIQQPARLRQLRLVGA